MAKTIDERARQIVHEWIEHDLDESLHSEYVASLKPESLQERISSALLEVAREQREASATIVESFQTIHEEIVSNDDLVLNAKLRVKP